MTISHEFFLFDEFLERCEIISLIRFCYKCYKLNNFVPVLLANDNTGKDVDVTLFVCKFITIN